MVALFTSFTANVLPGRKIRRESLNGRDYLVAPATLLVPGVLNGSQGPLYYPESEVARSVEDWNGIPVVAPSHPEVNGINVSARDPTILAAQGIGYVYRATANTDTEGKLYSELWLDIETTNRVDDRILSALEKGEPLELSTGLYTENVPVSEEDVEAKKNVWTNASGEPVAYTHVARNYKPDHLAILPDKTGACSVKDGCGVLVNEDTIPSLVERFTLWLTGNVKRLHQPRSRNTGYFKKFGTGTGRGPVHSAAQAGALVLTGADRELGTDALAQITEGINPPNWVPEEMRGKWDQAIQEVEGVSTSTGKKYTPGTVEYWGAVSSIFQRKGGQINRVESTVTSNETVTDVTAPVLTTNEGTMDRAATIKWLTTNCTCWKGKEKTLNAFTDQDLKHFKQEADHAAKFTLIVNATTGKKTKNADGEGEAVPGVPYVELAQLLGVDVDPASDPVAFATALKGVMEEIVAKLSGAAPAPETPEVPVAMAELTEEEKKAKEAEMAAANASEREPTGNRRKPPVARIPTTDQWLASAPPEVRSAVQNSLRIEKEERQRLIGLLVVNVAEGQRQATAQVYSKMTTDQLKLLVSTLPTVNSHTPPTAREPLFTLPNAGQPNYNGAQGGPVFLQLTDNEAADVLDMDAVREAYEKTLPVRKAN